MGLATADGGSKEMIDAPMIKQVTPPFSPRFPITHYHTQAENTIRQAMAAGLPIPPVD